ncbi:MAG: hypothetical protein U1A78_15420 [Polyangia bacterium]
MGEVIRRTAAVDDILSDVRESHLNAQAAGGLYKTLAEQTLKPALALCDLIDGKWRAAVAKSEPLLAAQAARNTSADLLVARVSDVLWSDVGRPMRDPQYDLLFPGGITFYTDGEDAEQPARMELLAELIESGVHARLDAAKAKDYAKQIRDEAVAFEAAVDAARKPRAYAAMYERMRIAAIRSAHGALTSFKRLLKANNISEAKIHEIIPDRPAAPRTPTPPLPAPPAP